METTTRDNSFTGKWDRFALYSGIIWISNCQDNRDLHAWEWIEVAGNQKSIWLGAMPDLKGSLEIIGHDGH